MSDNEIYSGRSKVEINFNLLRSVYDMLPNGVNLNQLTAMLTEVQYAKKQVLSHLEYELEEEALIEQCWESDGYCSHCLKRASFCDWRKNASRIEVKRKNYVCEECRVCQFCKNEEAANRLGKGRFCQSCWKQPIIKREALRVDAQRKRATTFGEPCSLIPRHWFECLTYFEWQCAYCQKTEFTCMEHFVSIGQKVGTTALNCLPACNSCNSSKKSGSYPQNTSDEAIQRIQNWWRMIDEQTRN